MPAKIGAAATASALLLALSVPLNGQAVETHELREHSTEAIRGFTEVVAVRELRDGRVLLVDRVERHVYLLSSDLSSVRQVAEHGEGPTDYLLPSALFELGSGRTAVRDDGQSRLLILDADGSPTDAVRLPADRRTLAVDAQESYYASGRPTAQDETGQWVLVDSVPILRSRDEGASWDTVTFRPADPGPDREVTGGIPAAYRGSERVPFRPTGTWAVAPDGTVAIVHPDPYRVEVVGPLGTMRRGPAIEYHPVVLSEEHKLEYLERQARPRVGMIVSLRDNERQSQVGQIPWPSHEPEEWPETLPPFLEGAANFAPDGFLWIERTGNVGESRIVDIFDEGGVLARRVALPSGHRIVGFGSGSLYVVWRDSLDLEHLRRMEVPWMER